jgi:hypothetical protein
LVGRNEQSIPSLSVAINTVNQARVITGKEKAMTGLKKINIGGFKEYMYLDTRRP